MAQTLDAIDISDNPELLRLVEAVHAGHAPRVLRAGGKDVAIMAPIETASEPRAPRPKTPEDYAAFRSSAGSWADVDTDKLIEEIYEQRRRSSRPPVDL